jgi:hypothetical protein
LHLVRDDGQTFAGLVSMVYGLAAYLLGPLIGAAIGRLVAYGWPLAWIAAPEQLTRYFNTNDRLLGKLACLQAIACWPPLLIKELGVALVPTNLVSLAIALPCHVIAWRLLWRNRAY